MANPIEQLRREGQSVWFGYVEDSGEGRWTALEAVQRGVAGGTLTQSLFSRFTFREEDPFSMRVVAALRNEFGGHAVKQQ